MIQIKIQRFASFTFITVDRKNFITNYMRISCGRADSVMDSHQFRPPIALRTDLSHITTELWEIPVLRMAH